MMSMNTVFIAPMSLPKLQCFLVLIWVSLYCEHYSSGLRRTDSGQVINKYIYRTNGNIVLQTITKTKSVHVQTSNELWSETLTSMGGL